jgi:uncharacterized protein involved in exopolysaccharide biosynthesis
MALSQTPLQPRETGADPAAKFRRYYYLVLRRLWLVLLIVAVGVGGAWAWLQRQPFVYSSTATILVEQAEPRVVKMDKVGNDSPESPEFVFTAVQMLEAKELMLRVAKSLTANKNFESRVAEARRVAFVRRRNRGRYRQEGQGQVAAPHATDRPDR